MLYLWRFLGFMPVSTLAKLTFELDFYTDMAIKITDECINCGACEPECPNNAIYDAGAAWRYSDGTSLRGLIQFPDGITVILKKHVRLFQTKYTLSYLISVPNVWVSMMSLNVPPFAR